MIPIEPGIQVLRGLVGAQVETPVEVERRRLEPVALPEAVGEALERVARRVDPDEVAAAPRGADLGERGVGLGDRTALDALGRRRLGVVEQERIVGDERALLAELAEQRGEADVVDAAIARQPDAAARVALAFDEIDRERLLVDGARLADVGVVEPDEVGAFARDVGEQHLVADERRRRPGDQLVEVRLRPALVPRARVSGNHALVPRARVSGNHAHCSPPNTSTFENLHAGDAWPVPISWLSSPLPQFGVPITVKLLRSATPVRLRQNVEEMPR